LLIADDVGLAKTIEAGMTALELIIRHRARRILVVCPSALQIQWREQMRDMFGLDFRIVDSKWMKVLRRDRSWDRVSRSPAFQQLLKRRVVAQPRELGLLAQAGDVFEAAVERLP
jgi:SNF2 family DNA or RNA helicase